MCRLYLYLTASLLFCQVANAQWQGYAGLATEYNYRGLSFTENDIAANAMLEYLWKNGIYAGVWIGNIDLPDSPLGSEEVDYLLGYSHRINRHAAIETTFIRYSYPNSTGHGNYDWNEWQLAVHIDQHWTVRMAVNNNWLSRDKTARVVELSWRQTLAQHFTYDLTVGLNDAENVIGTDYRYQELGLNYSWKALELRVSLTGADARAATVFGANNTENRWAFSVTWLY